MLPSKFLPKPYRSSFFDSMFLENLGKMHVWNHNVFVARLQEIINSATVNFQCSFLFPHGKRSKMLQHKYLNLDTDQSSRVHTDNRRRRTILEHIDNPHTCLQRIYSNNYTHCYRGTFRLIDTGCFAARSRTHNN